MFRDFHRLVTEQKYDFLHGKIGSHVVLPYRKLIFSIGDTHLYSRLVFHWILLVFFFGGGVRGYNHSYQFIRPFIVAPRNSIQVEYILGISVLHSIVSRFKAWPPVVPQNWVGSSQGIHGISLKRWSWMSRWGVFLISKFGKSNVWYTCLSYLWVDLDIYLQHKFGHEFLGGSKLTSLFFKSEKKNMWQNLQQRIGWLTGLNCLPGAKYRSQWA